MNSLKNIFLFLSSTVILLLLLEIFFSITDIAATSSLTQPVDPTSPIIHFKSNHEFLFARNWNADIKVKHRTNNYGYNTYIQFDKGDLSTNKAVLIGDSYVEALQVDTRKSVGGLLHERSRYNT